MQALQAYIGRAEADETVSFFLLRSSASPISRSTTSLSSSSIMAATPDPELGEWRRWELEEEGEGGKKGVEAETERQRDREAERGHIGLRVRTTASHAVTLPLHYNSLLLHETMHA